MRWFWQTVAAVLDVLRPKLVVEIGAEHGDVTAPLLGWADAHGAVVHVIDPEPQFDVVALRAEHPASLRMHRARSLRVLPHIKPPDLVLVDGDHNWYTVFNELRQLERGAERSLRLPPLVLLHDVEWPYARRDLYYEPTAIPARYRHPFARAGIRPGRDALGRHGLNSMLNNAQHEGGERNGVLTAVEDFISRSPRGWTLTIVPGLYGLGILAPAQLLSRRRRLRDLLAYTQTAGFLEIQCRRVELERIHAAIRATESAPADRSQSC
jgi:hypothetical protein